MLLLAALASLKAHYIGRPEKILHESAPIFVDPGLVTVYVTAKSPSPRPVVDPGLVTVYVTAKSPRDLSV